MSREEQPVILGRAVEYYRGTSTRVKVFLWSVLAIGGCAGLLWLNDWFSKRQGQTPAESLPVAAPALELPAAPETGGVEMTPTAAGVVPTESAGRDPRVYVQINGVNFTCAWVNNPSQPDYMSDYPTTRNAMRALMLAGNENERLDVEGPPFVLLNRNLEVIIGPTNDWKALNPAYNRTLACYDPDKWETKFPVLVSPTPGPTSEYSTTGYRYQGRVTRSSRYGR